MRNKNKPTRGQALVEFALVLPIFIFVIFGIVDFGRAFHCWTSLNYQCIQAVRAGTKDRIRLLQEMSILPQPMLRKMQSFRPSGNFSHQ